MIYEHVLILMGSISITIILARGKIFDPGKDFIISKLPGKIDLFIGDFMYCCMCIGFWVGVGIETILDTLYFLPGILPYIFFGGITSIGAFLLDIIIANISNEGEKNGY